MMYGRFAQVYDALAYDEDPASWAAYVLSLFPKDASDVLEYCCGTGRITKQLVEAGMQVVAVDRSADMLTEAAQKLRGTGQRCRLVQADMTEFRMETPVDTAVCACDGVNYIVSDNALATFFSAVQENLRPGGTFLFDISSQYKYRVILGNEFYYDDGDEETLFWQNSYDDTTGLCEMALTVFRAKEDVYERFDETHVQRAWPQERITDGLTAAGFENVKAFGFGTTDPPREDADRIQFCAIKKGSPHGLPARNNKLG